MTDKKQYAFPDNVASNGMTLRDYFAAKAMNGMISDGFCCIYAFLSTVEKQKLLASRAYEIADAMLKAREQPTDESEGET